MIHLSYNLFDSSVLVNHEGTRVAQHEAVLYIKVWVKENKKTKRKCSLLFFFSFRSFIYLFIFWKKKAFLEFYKKVNSAVNLICGQVIPDKVRKDTCSYRTANPAWRDDSGMILPVNCRNSTKAPLCLCCFNWL
jgi:hypothetical protein